MGNHTFTRQELYDLIWSEPMIKVAAQYGISGNGLAKACRKADIPVPERGYWNRVQAGRKVKRPPLPVAGPNTAIHVTIRPPLPKSEVPPSPPVPPSVLEKIEAERRTAMPIAVFATLSSPHPIIAAWLEEDRQRQRDRMQDSFFRSHSKPVDGTHLDKRRLRILSALCKGLERRGYTLSVDSTYRRRVQIKAGQEKLDIQLEEQIRQVRRRLTDGDLRERGRYFTPNQKWIQEKVATGDLVLKILGASGHGFVAEWHDAVDASLESKLSDVLPQIAGAFEELRLRRVREAEDQARRWKLEEERRLNEMERKREMIRYRRLLSHCGDWRTAAELRAFVTAIVMSPLASTNLEQFIAWKSWALGHADRIDPLTDEDVFDMQVSDYEVYASRD
jgi:hypothetical protein